MADPIFSTKSTCTLLWKIENFNCLWFKNDEAIESPLFTVGELENIRWSLILYPRGGSSTNNIELYLKRNEHDISIIQEIDLYFELAFLSENGSILCFRQSARNAFRKGGVCGFESFTNRENVHFQNKSKHQPFITLAAQCKIWRCDKKAAANRLLFVETRVAVQQTSFQWQIDKFSTIECHEKQNLVIALTENRTLTLDLHLTGGELSEEVIDIDIAVSDNTIAKYLFFKTLIVDACGNFKSSGEKEFLLNDHEKKGTLTLLLSKNQLLNSLKNAASYSKEDVLTLHCECIYSLGIISNMINFGKATFNTVTASEQKVDGLSPHDIENIRGLPIEDAASLKEDMESLFNRDILSDMKLRTASSTIPVHTQILGARSPVFRTMFANDMKETVEGCIDVTDLDDDTVKRMLLYMYTDKLEDLQWVNASQLYTAADKYDIASLRSKCGAILLAKLSPTNACQILTLADMHQDEVLKNIVQDYILKQGKTIFSSEEWKVFMKTQLQLAAEIMYMHCNKN